MPPPLPPPLPLPLPLPASWLLASNDADDENADDDDTAARPRVGPVGADNAAAFVALVAPTAAVDGSANAPMAAPLSGALVM